jgi:ankyrin repeat protein
LGNDDPRSAFIDASVWHGSLDESRSILNAHPEIAGADIHTAAILGDEPAIRRFLERDPANATVKGGPRNWDALTYLCFSKFLRLEPARSPGFVRAAEALLDAGASANTGFHDETHKPDPEWESALYGAAGVAHHAEMTRLLLERGADPNDNEVPYHAPETYDNAALRVLVEKGRLTAASLETMLLRKCDWHDYDGIVYLLEHGANPNRTEQWSKTALHQALLRDNAVRIIEALLQHGADPSIKTRQGNRSTIALAARRGRLDVLELFEKKGIRIDLEGVDRLIAACARNDRIATQSIVTRTPQLVDELRAEGGTLLSQFAGNGNTAGVAQLLDLGVPVAAVYQDGDGYFGIAPKSSALHVAAWLARHATVRLLIERGAPVDAVDGKGRTPLMLAVRACVDSYWTDRRSPQSVDALLAAGASVRGVLYPSGYSDVDVRLASHGVRS